MIDSAATRPYGVLGRVLGHSYTPTIYKELAGLEYVRFEREPEDLQAFMTGDEWEGTNVTIPYKRAVMEYLDELSPLAERMGNVNTITRLPDGRLRSDNTDYFGFQCPGRRAGRKGCGKKDPRAWLPPVVPRHHGQHGARRPGRHRGVPWGPHRARSTTATSHGNPMPRCSSTARPPVCSPTAPTLPARSKASMRSRVSSTLSTTPPARDSCSRPSAAASPASAACSCSWPKRRRLSNATPAKSPRASASWT